MLDASVTDVIDQLLRACRTAGRRTLPAELMQPVAALLTRLAVNPELRDEYCDAVWVARAAAEREFPGTEQVFSTGDVEGISDEEIARHGFFGLTPEQLADFASDPCAVVAIAEQLLEEGMDGELGEWLVEALVREEERRPPDPDRDRRFEEWARTVLHPPAPRDPC